jgi:hypothetical protein
MLYYPKWLSSFRFSDWNIPSTNSLSLPCPLHLCSDDLFNIIELETHTVEEILLRNFLFSIFRSSFIPCVLSHFPALRGYRNLQPDKPVAFNLPCAKQNCLMKDRIFCDVVPFCLTDTNFSEVPTATSIDYLKDETSTVKQYHS